MRRFLFLLYILLCTTVLYAEDSVVPTINAEALQVISEVEVIGNENIDSQRILSSLISKPGTKVNETKLIRDVSVIENMGYFESVEYKLKDSIKGPVVQFVLKENPVIEEVEFIGSSVFSDDELKAVLSIKEGEILDYKNVRRDMKALEAFYHDKGYSLMKLVRVSTPVSTDKNRLVFYVVEGKVEDIRVAGNEFTRDYVVLRELKMKPGDIFNQDVLQADGRRVFNLNFFKNVVPDFAPGTEKDTVILIWKIEEKKDKFCQSGWFFWKFAGIQCFSGSSFR